MGARPTTHPTPYPAVNVILARLLSDARAVLGGDFVGSYLYGSLSLGDFDPASSDADFLIVTRDVLTPQLVDRLAEMHDRIAASGLPWSRRLEGSYIPAAALQRYDPADAVHPSIGVDWAFGLNPHGPDWIVQRHIVREHGVVVAGPPPTSLIDPIDGDMLRAAMVSVMRDDWTGRLETPEWFRTREYQAFGILTMCRVLYTLEWGDVVSKPRAAAWAWAALGEPWRSLVERALSWRSDHTCGDMSETLAFIRYTLDRAAVVSTPGRSQGA